MPTSQRQATASWSQQRTLSAPRPSTFIAITGYGHDSDRAAAARAGFSHHLVKPVDPAKLLSILSTSTSTSTSA